MSIVDGTLFGIRWLLSIFIYLCSLIDLRFIRCCLVVLGYLPFVLSIVHHFFLQSLMGWSWLNYLSLDAKYFMPLTLHSAVVVWGFWVCWISWVSCICLGIPIRTDSPLITDLLGWRYLICCCFCSDIQHFISRSPSGSDTAAWATFYFLRGRS